MKQFAKKCKNSTNPNTRVLVRYALDKTHKRCQTRCNKRYQCKVNEDTLKQLNLKQTVDHSKDESQTLRKQIEDKNDIIKALNEKTLTSKAKQGTTHKSAISNTHILDKLHNESSINSDIIKAKQMKDAQLYAIIEFLKVGNATLLLTVNDNFQKTVLQGRYKYSERDGLTYNRYNKDLLVVPSYLRNHILKHYPDKWIHNGSPRMKNIILQNYY